MTGEGLECQVMITKDWFIFQCRGVRNTENLRAAGCCGTDAPGPLEVMNREPGEEVGTQSMEVELEFRIQLDSEVETVFW
jgi:hypothetical protein